MVAIALFIGLDQLWETSLLQGQQLLKSQTEKMARLLVQQTAYGAAPALQLENDEQLQWLAQALVLDPKVMSASIFSEDGVRLSFAQSVIDEELEPNSEELTSILEQYPPYVEAVSQDGKNLGYVEVRLEPKYFFNEIKEAHQINMEQQQMMLLIAGLIGMLLSRALSFKRADFDRRKARVKLRRLLAKKNEKAEAKAAKKQAVKQSSTVKSEADTSQAEEVKTATDSAPKASSATVNGSIPAMEASAVVASNLANIDTKGPVPEKPAAKPRAKAKAKPKVSTLKAEASTKPVAKPRAKPKAKAKPKTSDETKPSVKPKAPVKPKVKAVPESTATQKVQPKAESKADPKDED